VRFGAYHVYVPLLLKPAPRALAAQLWALKHGGPDTKGLDELQRLAASGRTSFPVDKDVPRTFYRTIGYRVCGERAVRVDILERLADLIRPALAWRPSSPAPQPAGAFEGIGFTVTQAMTSLTGSSGEDFASILRALGYRMEKRPKPVTNEPVTKESVKAAEAETSSAPETEADQLAAGLEPAADAGAGSPVDARADSHAQAASETVDVVEPASAPEAAHVSAASEASQPASGDAASDSSATAIAEHHEAPDSAAPPAETAAAAAEAGGAETAAEAPADVAADLTLPQASAATAEPELVEVWRPGGRSEERRGQRRPSQRGHQPRGEAQARGPGAAEGAPAPEGSGETAEADAAGKRTGQHRRPRGHQGEFRREREDGGERRPREHRAEHRSERGDRPEHGRSERPDLGKGRGGDHKDRRDFTPHREREKQADPNSPFAKLAALKAQLEAAAKERR
jgi:ATP-dependent RNA helicase SUPV3L1/SUV3